MIMDQVAGMLERFTKDLKEASSEERNHFTNSVIDILSVSTELMKTSPEFREAFGRVHNEFLKYPESQETIRQSLEAYNNMDE